MSNFNELVLELQKLIADTGSPIQTRAAYIVEGLLVRYADFYQNDPTFRQIGDMAIKIHQSKATSGEDGVMWGEVIHLVHKIQELEPGQ